MSDKRKPDRSGTTPARPSKATASSRNAASKKTAKANRAGRICPACGGVQPGLRQRVKAPKATGLRARRAARAGDPETLDTEPQAPGVGTAGTVSVREPLDAPTLISGIAHRVHLVLGETGLVETAPPAQLTAAVRKAVLEEFRTRAAFAGRLAEIDALLWSVQDHGGPAVRTAMAEHISALGIRRIDEPGNAAAFVVTEGEGDAFELLHPAYVDELTGKVILAGQLRRVTAGAGEGSQGGKA